MIAQLSAISSTINDTAILCRRMAETMGATSMVHSRELNLAGVAMATATLAL